MNIKKAIGAGLLVFAIQLAVINVLSGLVGPFLGDSTTAGYIWQAVLIVAFTVIVYYTAKWYFIGNKATIKTGVYLGLVLVATNFAVNLLQAIPAIVFKQDILQPLLQYVSSVPFLITSAVTVAGATLAGYLHHKKHACNIQDAVGACMPKEAEEAAK